MRGRNPGGGLLPPFVERAYVMMPSGCCRPASVCPDLPIAAARAARSCRWRGEAPEPRPGLKMGHIPGSKNLQWPNVLRDGRWASSCAAVGTAATALPPTFCLLAMMSPRLPASPAP